MTAAVETAGTTLRLREHATTAPLGRLLRAELRWVLQRRRTVFALVGLSLIAVVIGIGLSFASGGSDPITSLVRGNGMALPLISLTFLMALMLPLVASMFSADAIAGEAGNGTLRGLLVAPVGRLRLLGMKAFGVGAATLIAVLLTSVVALITGLILFGGGGMLTMSGDTVGFWDALGRVGFAVAWATLQMWAVAAVALAISTFTEHPLVVMAANLGGIIVFTVLGAIPQLSAIHPLLLTKSFQSATAFLGNPIDYGTVGHSSLVALCYLAIGLSVATLRMVNPR